MVKRKDAFGRTIPAIEIWSVGLATESNRLTADGNNNTGKLTIPFGSEGMDTLGAGDVFNGKMNVYWQFVYGLYPARRLMWQNREAAGCWNADNYLQFVTGWQQYLAPCSRDVAGSGIQCRR